MWVIDYMALGIGGMALGAGLVLAVDGVQRCLSGRCNRLARARLEARGRGSLPPAAGPVATVPPVPCGAECYDGSSHCDCSTCEDRRGGVEAGQILPLRRVCSWCGRVLTPGAPGAATSHTCCAACVAAPLAQIEARARRVAAEGGAK